jgi:hypothetical protein
MEHSEPAGCVHLTAAPLYYRPGAGGRMKKAGVEHGDNSERSSAIGGRSRLHAHIKTLSTYICISAEPSLL